MDMEMSDALLKVTNLKDQVDTIFEKVDYLEKRLDRLVELVERMAISMGVNPYG